MADQPFLFWGGGRNTNYLRNGLQSYELQFCTHIHGVNRKKSPLKISKKSSRGHSQGLPKIFRALRYRAHSAVIIAIAQLSCSLSHPSVKKFTALVCVGPQCFYVLNAYVLQRQQVHSRRAVVRDNINVRTAGVYQFLLHVLCLGVSHGTSDVMASGTVLTTVMRLAAPVSTQLEYTNQLKPCPHYGRKVRLSPKTARQRRHCGQALNKVVN